MNHRWDESSTELLNEPDSNGSNRTIFMTQILSEVSFLFGRSLKSVSYICSMFTVENNVLLAETQNYFRVSKLHNSEYLHKMLVDNMAIS